jgi:hypothetical protein
MYLSLFGWTHSRLVATPAQEKSTRMMCCLDGSNFVRFEDFTAATMNSIVFWLIETQFMSHGGHITSPLQIPDG